MPIASPIAVTFTRSSTAGSPSEPRHRSPEIAMAALSSGATVQPTSTSSVTSSTLPSAGSSRNTRDSSHPVSATPAVAARA